MNIYWFDLLWIVSGIVIVFGCRLLWKKGHRKTVGVIVAIFVLFTLGLLPVRKVTESPSQTFERFESPLDSKIERYYDDSPSYEEKMKKEFNQLKQESKEIENEIQ